MSRPYCDHAPAGACDVPGCEFYAGGHVCTTNPCKTVGCPNSRPAPALDFEPDERDLGHDVNPAHHAPEAVEAWREVEAASTKESAAGMVVKNVYGIDTAGHRGRGALPWHWCYGKQPVFVPGSVYADSPSGKRLAGQVSEDEAARINRDHELGLIAIQARGLSKDELAQLVGMSPARLARQRMKAPR